MLDIRTVSVDLTKLRNLERNPRFMTAAQFDRLVDNIRRDGTLTSFPLVYRGEILSGNHRVKAAIEAGVTEGSVIEITSELSKEQQTAIALSHNAITGQDDVSILQELYDALDLDHKGYSGLTDDSFKVDEIDIDSLSIGTPKYQELPVYFLPEEKEIFLELLKQIEKKAKTPDENPKLLARYADFNLVFEAVAKAKKQLNIHNSAIVLRVMAELALERLEQLEQQGGEQ